MIIRRGRRRYLLESMYVCTTTNSWRLRKQCFVPSVQNQVVEVLVASLGLQLSWLYLCTLHREWEARGEDKGRTGAMFQLTQAESLQVPSGPSGHPVKWYLNISKSIFAGSLNSSARATLAINFKRTGWSGYAWTSVKLTWRYLSMAILSNRC
jgi:hypothetical protein